MKNKFLLIVILMGFKVSVDAATPNWSVNSNDYEMSMTLTSVVRIDQVTQNDTADIVSVWYGNQIRGVAKPVKIQNSTNLYYLLVIYSDDATEMDSLTFKFYNANEDSVYTLYNAEQFTPNQNKGDYSNPYKLSNLSQVGIGEFPVSAFDGKVYPNPSRGQFTIASNLDDILTLRIYDQTGRLVFFSNPNSRLVSLNLNQLQPGTYFLRVTKGSGIETTSVVIQN